MNSELINIVILMNELIKSKQRLALKNVLRGVGKIYSTQYYE